MPSSHEPGEAERPAGQAQAMPARPYWLGIAVAVVGAVWLYGGVGLRQTAQYSAIGPGLFVTIIGGGLILLGLALVVQIWRGAETFTTLAPGEEVHLPALVLAVTAVLVPVLVIELIGFPITAAISFALVARAFGSRTLLRDLIGGLVLSAAAFYGFSKLGVSLGDALPFLDI